MSDTEEIIPAETEAHVDSRRPLTDALMADEMSKVFDDMEVHGVEEAAQKMVPMVSKNIDEAFENTSNWMSKSADDQEMMRDAHGKVEKLKANAKTMGIELSDQDALKMAFELEQKQEGNVPDELAPALEKVKTFYPDQPTHQTVANYAAFDELVRSNPAHGLSEIIKQTGHDELEVLRQMAARHSPAELQQHFALRDATTYVDAFLSAHPDANQDAMLEALSKMNKTGDYGRDLPLGL